MSCAHLALDAPRPRLCYLVKIKGRFGFHVKTYEGDESDDTWHYILGVHFDGPADRAGLKVGDRIVEVNGEQILHDDQDRLFARMQTSSDEMSLLVVDKETDAYFKHHEIEITGDLPNIQYYSRDVPQNTTSDVDPRIRLCVVHCWPDEQGFNMEVLVRRTDTTYVYHIGKVLKDGPAARAGLRYRDRIVAVNGIQVATESYKSVLKRIRRNRDKVEVLVVDAAADAYYRGRGITLTPTLPSVRRIEGPLQRPCKDMDHHDSPEVTEPDHEVSRQKEPKKVLRSAVETDDQIYGRGKQDRSTARNIVARSDNIRTKSDNKVISESARDRDSPVDYISSDINHRCTVTSGMMDRCTGSSGMTDRRSGMTDRYTASSGITKRSTGNHVITGKQKSESPLARLYVLRTWPDFHRYGFNFNQQTGGFHPGHVINKVLEGSPAKCAGLQVGDRIVEVNGVNVEFETDSQVLTHIKNSPNKVELLVVDPEADFSFKQSGTVINSKIPSLRRMECPRKKPEPRLLKMTRKPADSTTVYASLGQTVSASLPDKPALSAEPIRNHSAIDPSPTPIRKNKSSQTQKIEQSTTKLGHSEDSQSTTELGHSEEGQSTTELGHSEEGQSAEVVSVEAAQERDGDVRERDGDVRERDGGVRERDGGGRERDGDVRERDGGGSEREGGGGERGGDVRGRDGSVRGRDGSGRERDGSGRERDGVVQKQVCDQSSQTQELTLSSTELVYRERSKSHHLVRDEDDMPRRDKCVLGRDEPVQEGDEVGPRPICDQSPMVKNIELFAEYFLQLEERIKSEELVRDEEMQECEEESTVVREFPITGLDMLDTW